MSIKIKIKSFMANSSLIKLIGLVILLNVFVYSIMVYSAYETKKRYEENMLSESKGMAQSLELNTNIFFDRIEYALQIISDETEKYLVMGKINDYELNNLIMQVSKKVPTVKDIAIADSTGLNVYGIKIGKNEYINKETIFREVKEGKKDSLVILKPEIIRGSEYVVKIAKSIFAADGSFYGIVYASVNMDEFNKLLLNAKLKKERITISYEDMTLISSLENGVIDKSAIGSNIFSKQVVSLIEKNPESGSYEKENSVSGEAKNTVFYKKMSKMPFVVFIEQYPGDYLSDWKKVTLLKILISFLFTGFSVFMVRGLVKKVSNDFNQLNFEIEKNTYFQELLDMMPSLIWMKDKNDIYFFCNKSFQSFFGKSKENILGKTTLKLGKKQDAFFLDGNQCNTNSSDIVNLEVSTPIDTVCFNNNGKKQYFEKIKNTVKNTENQLVCSIGIGYDITKKIKEEEAVFAEKKMMAFTLVDDINDVVKSFIDTISALTESHVGYFHIIENNEYQIKAQVWSTGDGDNKGINLIEDEKEYIISCLAEWEKRFGITEAIICNDIKSLPLETTLLMKTMHFERELSVPVIYNGNTIAVVGVCNKQSEYNDKDISIINRFVSVFLKIIEQREAERQLINNEFYLFYSKEIINNIQHEIYLFNAISLEVILFNDFAANALGCNDNNENKPKYFSDINKEIDSFNFVQKLRNIPSNSMQFKSQHTRIDGSTYPVYIYGKISRYNNKQYLIFMAKDLSDEQLVNDENEKLQQQIKRMQSYNSFYPLVEGVSCGLKSFIKKTDAAINNSISLLKEGNMDVVTSSLTEINSLIKAPLALVEIISTDVPVNKDNKISGINETLSQLVNSFIFCFGNNVEIEWKPSKEEYFASISKIDIIQIITNLFNNAKDAITPPEGRIIIETSRTTTFENESHMDAHGSNEGYVIIEISDNGCGIEESCLQNIFEPFYTTKKDGSLGIGLAVVQEIINKNGGIVEVSSKEKIGTIFTIYLRQIPQVRYPMDESMGL